MSTARRTALTATLATTTALTISAAAWGISSTVAGEGVAASPVPASADVASPPDPAQPGDALGRGPGTDHGTASMVGRGYGRGGGIGQGWTAASSGGPGRGATPDRPGWRSSTGAPGQGSGVGTGSGGHADLPPTVAGATVTDEVAAQLAYLVEEEKLAGDIYALGESRYGARVFSNIARAEDSHADEVRALLQRYDLPDPTAAAATGEFTDPALQALYESLADQVRTSWPDAVAAGILIEETDIADLQALLARDDLPADVRAVAENLLAGSQRHLAAFQRRAS